MFVNKYTNEFNMLTAMKNLQELERHQVTRFISSVNRSIQKKVGTKCSVDAMNLINVVEKKFSKPKPLERWKPLADLYLDKPKPTSNTNGQNLNPNPNSTHPTQHTAFNKNNAK